MDETLKKQILEVQAGNREVLNDLIKQNNGLIWSIVKRFGGRGYELEDLYQIGAIGFIKAVQKFDFSYNVTLSTYAVTYIIGEIKRFLRDDGMIKVSRQTKATCQKALKIKEDYEKQGKNIGVKEIAKILKVSKDEVIASLEYKNCVESLYDKEDDDSNCLIDRIKTPPAGFDQQGVFVWETYQTNCTKYSNVDMMVKDSYTPERVLCLLVSSFWPHR